MTVPLQIYGDRMVAPLPIVTESPREMVIQLSGDGSGAPDLKNKCWPV